MGVLMGLGGCFDGSEKVVMGWVGVVMDLGRFF